MSKLKERIFNRMMRKLGERKVLFPHLDKPLKVLLIYESDLLERNDAIKTIRQDLLRRQMDVTMWGYAPKKEVTTMILPQSRILGMADYTFFGKLREDIVGDLRAEHYDLLIDLTTRPILSLRYIAGLANADFKVGLNLGEGVHDMLLSPPDFSPEQGDAAAIETTWLYDQIMRYITTIKSND
ncbi:MAG: hypothetical protein J6T80_00625 [Paludibacteraceae bacterium]|nr:hypothetical protein [Paludibacteraceae bacterium]